MTALRAQGTTIAGGTRAARMRGAFIIFQVAATLLLLVGGGLFVRTVRNAYAVDLGYPIDRTLVASINLESRGYFEGGPRAVDAGQAVYEQILSRVEALPGVEAVAAARMTVLSGGARSTAVSIDGRPLARDNSNALGVQANIVSHRYFETMNIPIVRGRPFDSSDGPRTAPVTIVNEALAKRLWPGEDSIGKGLRDERNILQTIVGVVPDTAYTSALEPERQPTYYLLLAQNYESGIALHVRAAANPRSLVPAIREAVRQVDDGLAVDRPQVLSEVLDQSLSRQRMMATLVGLFAVLALILAASGLYGVMAYAATERTPEIGIRLALGAQRATILSLVIGQALRLVGIGVTAGLVAVLVGARYIEAQLFGVTAIDPMTLGAGCAVLAIAGFAASVIPAIRAMRVDPIRALRP